MKTSTAREKKAGTQVASAEQALLSDSTPAATDDQDNSELIGIYEWASARPEWQQDALVRLATQGKLSDEDVEELQLQIEKINGLPVSRNVEPTLLAEDTIKKRERISAKTVFGSIGPVKNVDRLAEDQNPLRFSVKGITLIYGPNGSGKSGYCRLAKKLCRCLHEVTLRGNAYGENSGEPQEVTVTFQAGSKAPENLIWKSNVSPPQELAHISVFDAHSAGLYVDNERRIEFLPYELDLLNKLASALRTLEEKFSLREKSLIALVKVTLPIGYNEGTEVSKALQKLVFNKKVGEIPSEEGLRALAAWSPEDEERLVQLSATLKDDPVLRAKSLRQFKTSLEVLKNEIAEIVGLLSDEAISDLIVKKADAAKKRELAKTSAQGLFKEEPISDLGSDAWRQLLKYARDFAAEVFVDLPVPQIATGDYCVLCQQELVPEARARLERFDKYINDKTAQEAETAKLIFEKAARAVLDLKIKKANDIRGLLSTYAALSESRKNLADAIVLFYENAAKRHTAISTAIKTNAYDKVDALDKLPDSPESQITHDAAQLTVEAEECDALKREDGEQNKLRTEYASLADRKKLSTEIEIIVERRNKLAELKSVMACKTACVTTSVTNQVSKLRQQLLTPSLENNLKDEIIAFDLLHLPVKLDDWGELGDSKVQVGLDAIQSIEKTSEILSEGEQRALGLACFLAELKEIGSPHGIIIDDPVSSLDHVRTEAVAKRLVAEAKQGRQVIIFTHNLSFHYMTVSEARLAGIPCHLEWISKEGDSRFGVIDNASKPWPAMSVKDRIAIIKNKIDSIKSNYDHNNEGNRDVIRILYTKMRETWERTVEEILFADVINRFRPEVQTMRLRAAYVDETDYKAVFEGMTRCSRYSGHDKAADSLPPLPKITDISTELNQLETEVARMAKRKKELEAKGRAFEEGGITPEFLSAPDV